MYNLMKACLLPPICLIIIIALGMWTLKRHRKIGLTMIWGGIIFTYLLSLPVVAAWLAAPLQKHSLIPNNVLAQRPQAIVVLGGGRRSKQPEYNNLDMLSRVSTLRLQYAAYLAKKYNLPILTSGGRPHNRSESEAEIMNRYLKQIYNTNAKWLEDKSLNTSQNALYSAKILKQNNIKNILLVTSAVHMPRSVNLFKNAGLNVIPAGCDFIVSPFAHGLNTNNNIYSKNEYNKKTNTDNTKANTDNTKANTDNTKANTDNTKANTDNTKANTDNTKANTDNTKAQKNNSTSFLFAFTPYPSALFNSAMTLHEYFAIPRTWWRKFFGGHHISKPRHH